MNTSVDNLFNSPKATEKQIRSYFKSRGCMVRIVDGHVSFKEPNSAFWRDGRWIAEYHVVDGNVVHI